MLSSSRTLSRVKAAPLLLAMLAPCSAEAPNTQMDVLDTSHGAAGISGGASGQAVEAAGSEGSTSLTTAGSSGGIAQAGIGAGGSSGMSGAGTGNPLGGPGTGGNAGNAGMAATGGSADAGSSGDGGSGGTAGTDATAGTMGEAGSSSEPIGCEVSPITDEMRDQYQNMNNAYYVKYASANGVIVATGDGVDDEAVIRYCRLMGEMTSNEDVRQAILDDEMWFTMISESEQLSSLPQIQRAYGTSLDRRARGLGGLTPTICAEDSIMCMPGDPWDGDCICPHEAGHTLYSSGIARVPDLSSRLSDITDDARSSGRLANAYVWQDGNESGMMAWGVQVWYDCAINGTNGGYHSDINTRAELQEELPDFHQFLSELLPTDNEYEDCYANP